MKSQGIWICILSGNPAQYLFLNLTGDRISVSSYEGTFNIARLRECSCLVMLAAGTGFTPMVRLMYEAFYNDQNKTR